eukprot:TRINITY_DN76634_c0_g1_i1.p1 TRINITY_DN76634_c0_g1~~TRINITY_DN76634_c0_g1_i1.p1  ORF type:complete len:412 (-),score=49.04 TRINITY_DN76634_c0_g1_i1:51-1286(-)
MAANRPRVDNLKFYAVLGLDRDATSAEIKQNYKKLVVKHHPDKGGDVETFRQITNAYEVLSDPEKRRAYDQFGVVGDASASVHTSPGPSNLFDFLFGNSGLGGFGGRGDAPKRHERLRTKDMVHKLSVSLEDVYSGQIRKVALTRSVVDADYGVASCRQCDGQGAYMRIYRRGPMIQQVQSTCENCSGVGKVFKMRSARHVVDVHIPKGVPDGHHIILRGAADEHPGAETGDVIFIVTGQEHGLFKRRGADLYMRKSILLVDALCGCSIEVQHLDRRQLLVQTMPGEVIKPVHIGLDSTAIDRLRLMKAVKGEGMPTFREPFRYGNLFLVLDIEFPDHLSPEAQDTLRRYLPSHKPASPEPSISQLDFEVHAMVDMDPAESFRQTEPYMKADKNAFDEDDDELSEYQRSRL